MKIKFFVRRHENDWDSWFIGLNWPKKGSEYVSASDFLRLCCESVK